MPVELEGDEKAEYEALLAARQNRTKARRVVNHWGDPKADGPREPKRACRDGYTAELDLRYRGLRRA
jgi:hypothetical protein